MFLFFINSNLLKHNSELKHGDGSNEDPTKTCHLQYTYLLSIWTLPYCFFKYIIKSTYNKWEEMCSSHWDDEG